MDIYIKVERISTCLEEDCPTALGGMFSTMSDEYKHKPTQTVPALRLPPVGLLVEEKAKEDPPVPTPPNPGPPPKPVEESDTVKSVRAGPARAEASDARNTSEKASGVQADGNKHVRNLRRADQRPTKQSLTSEANRAAQRRPRGGGD